MDFKLGDWPSYAEDEWWRQWAIQSSGELSLLARWSDDWEQWQRLLRERVGKLLGWEQQDGEVEVQLLGQKDAQNFSLQKISFAADDGTQIPAYVCVPHDNETPLPAVVLSHDAGTSKEAMAGLLDEDNPDAAPGSRLAAAGYVVCCMDRRGCGERSRRDEAAQMWDWLGRPAVGRDAADLAAAYRALCQRPDVQRERIGIVGIGKGAAPALYAAIMETRLQATALCGYLTRYRSLPLVASEEQRRALGEVVAGTVPAGLLAYADFEDLACLIAPRPLCLYQRYEPDLPPELAAEAARRISEGYDLMGEKIRLRIDVAQQIAGHQDRTVLDFFDDWLKLPAPEKPSQAN